MTTQITKYYPKKKQAPILIAFLLVVCCILFLVKAQDAAQGVREGITICSEVIIPSLFCFMVLTSFITISGLNKIISKPFSFISRWGFRLNENLGCIPVMSFIGGYPIGANSIAEMIRKGTLSAETGQRMMYFCICPAPSFVITAVGCGMFHNFNTGIFLYIIQIVTAVLLGFFTSRSTKNEQHAFLQVSYPPIADSFVQAVNTSVLAISQMCGYILLFNALLSGLTGIIPSKVLFLCSGFLEVTTGCRTACTFPGLAGVSAVSFFLSFSGISVICQIAGILKDTGIEIHKVIWFRLIHGVLSAGITYLYFRLNPQSIPTFSITAATVPLSDPNTPILTGCLLFMCSMLLFSSIQKKRKW